MVLFGGLELVAAGYLIHKHNKNKKERARLEDEAAALDESSYPIFPADQRPPRRHTHSHSQTRPHKHSHSHSRPHTHSHSQSRPHTHSSLSLVQPDESDEDRRERRRRRREKRRKEEEFEFERTNSAPPKLSQTQTVVAPGVVAGWPAHWKQSQIPSSQPLRIHTPQPQTNPPAQMHTQAPHGYPQDVKYGFVPEIPHEQYPPPYSGPLEQPDRRQRDEPGEERREQRRGRERSEVRGRRERRNNSPMLGIRDEGGRSRVRFSTEDVVLGGSSNPPPKYRA